MKVCDVAHGRVTTLELRPSAAGGIPTRLPYNVEVALQEVAGDPSVCLGEDAWPVVGADIRGADALRGILSRNLPRLAWLVQQVPDKGTVEKLMLQVHEFPASYRWSEPMDIGVDDRLVEDLRKRKGALVSVAKAVQWLETVMMMPAVSEQQRVLLTGSPAIDGARVGFRILGDGFAADVSKGTDDRLRVVRVVNARRPVEGDDRDPVYLASGRIRFCDVTVAGEFRGIAKTELDQLVEGADSYLALWQKYNDREHAAVLHRARTFGWIAYTSRTELPDGSWRFVLKNTDMEYLADLAQKLDDLEEADLEVGTEVPIAIQGADAQVEAPSAPPVAGQSKGERKKPFRGEYVGRHRDPPTMDIRPPQDREFDDIPKKGFLFMSLAGDEKRLERRQNAWNLVRSCTNPMPQLGLLIEGKPVPERRGRKLKARTESVLSVLAHPNERQEMAIDRALNTPDIALIQGPPGTGKTRVLAALQSRLADPDEGVSPDGIAGNTLLSSFQHDAVENAADATRVMGLPAVKVGRKQGEEEIRDGVERWSIETAERVRTARAASGADPDIHLVLGKVRVLAVGFIGSPAHDQDPVSFLGEISSLAGAWLSPEVARDLAGLRQGLATADQGGSTQDDDRTFALKAVRSLRVTAAGFSDDGPETATKTLARLKRLDGFTLEMEAVALLETASEADPVGVSPKLLADLARLRDGLVDQLQAKDTPQARPRVHADVEDLVIRVIDDLAARAKNTVVGVEAAVDDWLSDLENDPKGIREAVQHYSMVLAATCQQSVSKAMSEAKSGEDTVFRTVVVDEAARANPLDLLIPMSRAERRIVLVGDHRQLPHLLEPDIERELETSIKDETREALRQSLFRRLFQELRAREKVDGVKRTVTLNVQYRMHPVLGAFVSAQFYAPHGEGFSSGRPAEDFAHDVFLGKDRSMAGRVAAWIDVPLARGAEEGRKSRRRRSEARVVACEAKAIVERHPELSVGVITFYAAQRDEILDLMAAPDLALTEYEEESGSWRVKDGYRLTQDKRERLRIGTVDAFQGKEFDVVLLSLTRSNAVEVKDEASRRRKYGFLLLENRLCVAMSRQHRLLVVVGDVGMASGPDAEASVPGLVAFRQLCEGPHGRRL